MKGKVITGLFITLIVLSVVGFASANVLDDFFGLFKPKVQLSPGSTFTGLPEGFSPTAGYYNPFGDGVIGLWQGNEYYTSEDGTNFQKYFNPIGTLGLPISFIPDVAYAHDIQGGLVGLWDNSQASGNKYYIVTFSKGVASKLNLNGIPAEDNIILGYWHKFGGVGRVTLFNDKGDAYLWDSSKGTISKLDRAVLTQFGLPTLRNPQVAYYYNFNGMERVDIWYGNVLFRSTGGNFAEVKTVSGISGTPKVGYWDRIRNKIVVWVGPIAYESSNGNDFVEVIVADEVVVLPVPNCDIDGCIFTLNEGEIVTIEVNENLYDVSIVFISPSTVKLNINGQVTNSLAEADTPREVARGVYVDIQDIIYFQEDYAGGTKQVTVRLFTSNNCILNFDVDRSGIISIIDANRISDCILSSAICSANDRLNSDLDCDGRITGADKQIVDNYLNDVENECNPENPNFDVDRSGEVDGIDLQYFLLCYPSNCAEVFDFNCDGLINALDDQLIRSNFPPSGVVCTDSDGGRNYYVTGIADARDSNGLGIFAPDRCIEKIGNAGEPVSSCYGIDCYLEEGYCDNVDPKYQSWIKCEDGCSDGACVGEMIPTADENCELVVDGQFIDSDGDGCHAGFDSDCGGVEGVDDASITCNDGIDNDCDGMIDFADNDESCVVEEEIQKPTWCDWPDWLVEFIGRFIEGVEVNSPLCQ